ncbi:MAG: Fic family protein [Rhodospirillales bacterium]|nr:Fic family protein [Rhodospirillales bacterium]
METVYDLLQKAEQELDGLARAVLAFDDPALLRLLSDREITRSSAAEGTTTTFDELGRYRAAFKFPIRDRQDAEAVLKACQAHQQMADAARSGHPADFVALLGGTILGQSVKTVANGTADPDRPGGYFHFAPPDQTRPLLHDWAAFLDEAGGPPIPTLLRHVLGHWLFEHIHPFADGNGRLGRSLLAILPSRDPRFPLPIAFIGEAVAADRPLYVEALKKARREADWTHFSRLVLAFLAHTAQRNRERVAALDGLCREWLDRLGKRYRRHSTIHALCRWAITHPIFIPETAIQELKKTHASIGTAIRSLEALGFLERVPIDGRQHLCLVRRALKIWETGP